MKKINTLISGIALAIIFGFSFLSNPMTVTASELEEDFTEDEDFSEDEDFTEEDFTRNNFIGTYFPKIQSGFAHPEILDTILVNDYSKVEFPEYIVEVPNSDPVRYKYPSGYITQTFKFTTSSTDSFYKFNVVNISSSDDILYRIYNEQGELITATNGGSYNLDISKGIAPIIKLNPSSVYFVQLATKNSKYLKSLSEASVSIERTLDDSSDTFNKATVVNLNTSKYGKLNGYNDVDTFKFTTKSNEAFYNFYYYNKSSNALKYVLYNNNKDVVKTWTCNPDATINETISLDKNKGYYIQIQTNKLPNVYTAELVNDYEFRVTSIDDDYAGINADATEIKYNKDYNVSIDQDNDLDIVKFNSKDVSKFTLHCENYSDTDYIKYVVQTYNETGIITKTIAKSYSGDVIIEDKNFQKNTDYFIVFSGKEGVEFSFNIAPVKRYVYYELNSGTQNSKNPSYFNETNILSLYSPTREGYKFAGWFTTSSFSAKTQVTTVGNQDSNVTLYAKWEPSTFNIKYNLNGGTNDAKNPTTFNPTKATAILNPTRKGYTFSGWYTDAKFKTKVTSIAKSSTGNKTLYAKWTANKYTIKYKLNSGKNNSKNPSSYNSGAAINLSNPTRKGYTFSGWYKNSKFKTKVTSIAKSSTGNKTLYAKWTKTSAKTTTVNKLTSKSKSFTVTAKKVSSISRYQVQYATNKSFKSAKSKTFASSKNTITIKSLKSKKTYYVRIRTYKKDSVGNKVYSKWSKAKTIKVK